MNNDVVMPDTANKPPNPPSVTSSPANANSGSHHSAVTSASGAAAGQTQEYVDFTLVCKINNSKIVSNLLQAIYFKKDQMVTCQILRHGLKFTFEESKILQVNAFLQKDLFNPYEFREQQPARFKINLQVLLECLNVLGISKTFMTKLQMCYAGYAHPLLLMLEESNVNADCGIQTLDTEPILDFQFRSEPIHNKCIIKSEELKEALNDLDLSANRVSFMMSPDPPHFRLSTDSTAASSQIDYPKDAEIFESFESTKTQVNNYRLGLLQPTIKILNTAVKTSVSMNEKGMLQLKHMMKNESETLDNQYSFIEVLLCPDEADDADSTSDTTSIASANLNNNAMND